MNIKRMGILVKYMASLPPEYRARFDMAEFFRVTTRGLAVPAPGACGTTACAAGYACTVPAFNDCGLYMRPRPRDKAVPAEPCYGSETGVSAIMRFFSMNMDEFEEFFGIENDDDSPAEWAGRATQALRLAAKILKESACAD